MAVFIFLSYHSTQKSQCSLCTLFLPSTRAQNIPIALFVVETLRLSTIIIIVIIINNLFYVGKKKNMYIAHKLINANKIV